MVRFSARLALARLNRESLVGPWPDLGSRVLAPPGEPTDEPSRLLGRRLVGVNETAAEDRREERGASNFPLVLESICSFPVAERRSGGVLVIGDDAAKCCVGVFTVEELDRRVPGRTRALSY